MDNWRYRIRISVVVVGEHEDAERKLALIRELLKKENIYLYTSAIDIGWES